MKSRFLLLSWIIFLGAFPGCSGLFAGTPGTFRGTVVEAPKGDESAWIYLLGRNGQVRRVDISHSEVTYAELLPEEDRRTPPKDTLIAGAQLRVTAEQDDDGEWRAIHVEILSVAAPGQRTAPKH
jgi:hypothetical protein